MSAHESSAISMPGRHAAVLRSPAHDASAVSLPGRHASVLYEFVAPPPAVVSYITTESGNRFLTESGNLWTTEG